MVLVIEMDIMRLRESFMTFLKQLELGELMVCESSSTAALDPLLKYERIDRYRVLFIGSKELASITEFCRKYGIDVWLGDNRMCVGYDLVCDRCFDRTDSLIKNVWVAYCKECGEVDKAPNGAIIEAAAKRHKREMIGHTVILGTYIDILDAILSVR